MLRLHLMILDALNANRLERAVPDMQGDGHAQDTAHLQLLQQGGRKVQAGRRRRNRPTVASKHGLVTLAVKGRIAALKAADPDNKAPIPVDLVTASASGLDPHISPAAADYQVGRVAKVRGLDSNAVRELVVKFTEKPQLGVLGDPRVNVLELNLALDELSRTKTQ